MAKDWMLAWEAEKERAEDERAENLRENKKCLSNWSAIRRHVPRMAAFNQDIHTFEQSPRQLTLF